MGSAVVNDSGEKVIVLSEYGDENCFWALTFNGPHVLAVEKYHFSKPDYVAGLVSKDMNGKFYGYFSLCHHANCPSAPDINADLNFIAGERIYGDLFGARQVKFEEDNDKRMMILSGEAGTEIVVCRRKRISEWFRRMTYKNTLDDATSSLLLLMQELLQKLRPEWESRQEEV